MQSGNEILASLYNITKSFFLSKNYTKNVTWNLAFLNFQRILCKKDSVEVSMLIRTNFGRFSITNLI